MIKINDKYSCKRDQYCWHLIEHYIGEDRKGNQKEMTRTTYHSHIRQMAAKIVDNQTKDCESIEEIVKLLEKAIDNTSEFMEIKIKEG